MIIYTRASPLMNRSNKLAVQRIYHACTAQSNSIKPFKYGFLQPFKLAIELHPQTLG